MTSTSLPGFKTLLYGDSGDGKTHALRTLLAHGITPFVQATEPGMRALARCVNAECPVCKSVPASAAPIPYNYVAPGGDLAALTQQAGWVSEKDQKFLCNINDGTRKTTYGQFSTILRNMENFTDSTGKAWGNVGSWGTDRAYVLDGLTGAGDMAMDLFAGRRPLYDKPDYQVAQSLVQGLVEFLTCQIRCHVVIVGHLDGGQEDVMGRSGMTGNVMAPGRKLAPQLPRLFDDMPFAYREGDKFYWSTAKFGVKSKARNLRIADKLVPDFGPIVESWKRAGGRIQPTEVSK